MFLSVVETPLWNLLSSAKGGCGLFSKSLVSLLDSGYRSKLRSTEKISAEAKLAFLDPL